MRPLIKLVLLYIACVLYSGSIILLFGGQLTLSLKRFGFWVGPGVLILIGIIIGIIINKIKRNMKSRQRIIFLSALTTCLAFWLIFAMTKFAQVYHDREYGNIEHNENYLKWAETYIPEKTLAFNTLMDNFKNKNEIYVRLISATLSDTLVNKSAQVYYTIEIIYLKDKQRGNFKSDVMIFHDTAYLQFFDKPLTIEEVRALDRKKNEVINRFEGSLKDMSDSLRNVIQEEFNGIGK